MSIIISSTQYPGYGGAATNAYALVKAFRNLGYDTCGIFFHNTLDVVYDPDNIGGIFLYLYKKFKNKNVYDECINYLKKKPIICFAKNYIAPIYCKNIFNCFTIYLVSGINHFPKFFVNDNLSAHDILNININYLKYKIIDDELICNDKSDLIVLNSQLSINLFNKIYPQFINKIYKYPIDTTQYLNTNNNINTEKEYDILLCSSNLERKDKNNEFLINILNNKVFNKYKKCFIGKNFQKFKDINNSLCTGLLKQKECLQYMNKSKVLLFPSLFDANPNTVRESCYYKCLPLISNNIGFYEKFPDYLVCKTYDEKEWISKIKYILDNYDKLIGETKIDFTNNFDINYLLENINY
jgi:glycosyltransferase involved in cell wall biosynthesis